MAPQWSFPALEARYETSRALIIGIDQYKNASPLRYARSDAEGIQTVLTDKYGFHKEHLTVLLDKDATRKKISAAFLSYSGQGTNPNDRLLVFFAGHGVTVSGRRGEVGFLVPYDGDPKTISSLIRWDELTRNADIIPAKHILFLMDACYGGLAITRAVKPGSMRFLKDMLRRPARQVLTAGKADEPVADHGGPIPAHSVFTGHLLEGLDGKASDADGVITANGLMAYTYQQVSRDGNSRQTPDFGCIDGDGDFIFSAPFLEAQGTEDRTDSDKLVVVPALLQQQPQQDSELTTIQEIKECLSEPRHRIRLSDLVVGEARRVLSETSEDSFPLAGPGTMDEFKGRLERYEKCVAKLRDAEALIGYWGLPEHESALTLGIRRLAGRLQSESGLSAWIALRWYPILILMYAAGIASVAANNYRNVKALFETRAASGDANDRNKSILLMMWSEISEAVSGFKSLPGHERNFVPLSEYLFKLLQPDLEELLFLGSDYEEYFDRFEVVMALEHGHQFAKLNDGRVWAPVGRFGYKHYHRGAGGPFARFISEYERQGEAWSPLAVGLFGGSGARVHEIRDGLSQLLKPSYYF